MTSMSIEVCRICKKPMLEPKILPCTHSFCLKCLESTINLRKSKCPTCQNAFQVPSGGLKNLKNNYFIEQLNALKQSSITCKENQATKFSYCSTCVVLHGNIPVTSEYRLQPKGSSNDNIYTSQYPLCEDHVDIMNIYCEDCNVLLCGRCLISGHKSHKINHISDHFESVKSKFEQTLRMKEETLRNVVLNYRKARSSICDCDEEATNLKKEIQQRGEDVKKIVDSVVTRLINDVDKELKLHKEEADDIIKKLKSMEDDLKSQIETMNWQLCHLNYQNFVETSSELSNETDTLPKYFKTFSMTFLYNDGELKNNLDKIIGHLHKAESKNSVFSIPRQTEANKSLSHVNQIGLTDSGEWEPLEYSIESTSKPNNFLHKLSRIANKTLN